ncbi:hypothetical protein ACFQX7_39610 [Luedemannella flava]
MRLRRAVETTDTKPVFAGAIAALCTAAWLGTMAAQRRSGSRQQASVRTWMVIGWLVAVFFALIATHSRRGYEPGRGELTSAVEVGVVTYLTVIAGLFIVGIVALFWWQHRANRPITHDPDDLVEVWRVEPSAGDRRRKPYFEARCECGWSGQHIYETTPGARSKAFAIAHRHGSHVVPELFQD